MDQVGECQRLNCHMEQHQTDGAYKINFTYHILPIQVNLHLWELVTSDLCRANLRHILTGCEYALKSSTRKQ